MYISCAFTMRPLAYETEQVPLIPNFWGKVGTQKLSKHRMDEMKMTPRHLITITRPENTKYFKAVFRCEVQPHIVLLIKNQEDNIKMEVCFKFPF